jgi:hypothetical protein
MLLTADSYSYQPIVEKEQDGKTTIGKHSSDTLLTRCADSPPSKRPSRITSAWKLLKIYLPHIVLLSSNVIWTLVLVFQPSQIYSSTDLLDVPCKNTQSLSYIEYPFHFDSR